MIRALRERLTGTTDSGTAVDVNMPSVKPGHLARVRFVSCQNDSGESVTWTLGLLDSGSFVGMYANQTIADGEAFGLYLDLALLEGDVLVQRVKGSAKSGPVHVVFSGEIADLSGAVNE